MSDEPQHGAKGLNRRFQFSLRTLMGLTAAVALFCGMWSWRGELGVLEFFYGTAVCVIVVGVVRRSLRLILIGILLWIGIQMSLSFSARRTAIRTGSGSRVMSVPIQVVDATTKRPIADALVRIFVGRPNRPPVPTDANGNVDVDAEMPMFIEEYDTLIGTRGHRWISFTGVAVAVDALGYQSAFVRLGDHHGSRHDLPGEPLPRITVTLQPENISQKRPGGS